MSKLKYCRHCRWHWQEPRSSKDLCFHPKAYPLWGSRPQETYVMRTKEPIVLENPAVEKIRLNYCGHEGRFFEPKLPWWKHWWRVGV
jgi:hypothetical protein